MTRDQIVEELNEQGYPVLAKYIKGVLSTKMPIDSIVAGLELAIKLVQQFQREQH